nr:hypothetical protein [Tanacetum cinerariifolium]
MKCWNGCLEATAEMEDKEVIKGAYGCILGTLFHSVQVYCRGCGGNVFLAGIEVRVRLGFGERARMIPRLWILDKFVLHVHLFLKILLPDPVLLLVSDLVLKFPGCVIRVKGRVANEIEGLCQLRLGAQAHGVLGRMCGKVLVGEGIQESCMGKKRQ